MKTQDSSIRLLHLFVPNGSFKGLYKSLEFPKRSGHLILGPYNEDPTI